MLRIKQLSDHGFDFSKLPASLRLDVDLISRYTKGTFETDNQKIVVLDDALFDVIKSLYPHDETIMRIEGLRDQEYVHVLNDGYATPTEDEDGEVIPDPAKLPKEDFFEQMSKGQKMGVTATEVFKSSNAAVDPDEMIPLKEAIDDELVSITHEQLNEIAEYLDFDKDYFFYNSDDILHTVVYWKDYFFYAFFGGLNMEVIKFMGFGKKLGQYRQHLNEAIENKQYEHVFDLLDKKIIIPLFVKHFGDFPDDQKYDLFMQIYTRSEYGFEQFPEKIIKACFALREESGEWKKRMRKLKSVMLLNDDGTVTVYRGQNKLSADEQYAYSWTLKKKTAEFFANRFERGRGVVIQKNVRPKEIIDYINDRNESEVLLMPEKFVKQFDEGGVLENAMRLIHVSKSSFDEFDLRYMNSGEGAQAFGWGIYVTNSENVEQYYKKKLIDLSVRVNGIENDTLRMYLYQRVHYKRDEPFDVFDKSIDFKKWFAKEIVEDNNWKGKKPVWPHPTIHLDEKETRELLDELNNPDTIVEVGRDLYRYIVELHGDRISSYRKDGYKPFVFLDWNDDLPQDVLYKIKRTAELLEENDELWAKTFNYFNKISIIKCDDPVYSNDWDFIITDIEDILETMEDDPEGGGESGKSFYKSLSRNLGCDRNASLFLLLCGINGIKYKAVAETGGESGQEFNFVIFDPDNAQIIEKIKYKEGGSVNGAIQETGTLILVSEKKYRECPANCIVSIDLNKERFDIKKIKNRRFIYIQKFNTVILGGNDAGKNSHVNEYWEIIGSNMGFDDTARGWVGFHEEYYPDGIIHFSPGYTKEHIVAWPYLYDRMYDALLMFMQNGANSNTKVRGFGSRNDMDMGDFMHVYKEGGKLNVDKTCQEPVAQEKYKGLSNAWISPTGKLYWVAYMGHNAWANEYLEELWGIDFIDIVEKRLGGLYASEYLCQELDWLRLVTWGTKPEVVGATISQRPNKEQEEELYIWCAINKIEYDSLF